MGAIYFIIREPEYLEEKPDGTHQLQTCACHKTQYVFQQKRQSVQMCRGCDDHGAAAFFPHKAHACQVLPPKPEPAPPKLHACAGAALGIFQGLCCPVSLMGVSFLAGLRLVGIACFLATFTISSALGTGAIATCWAHATRGGLACVSERV